MTEATPEIVEITQDNVKEAIAVLQDERCFPETDWDAIKTSYEFSVFPPEYFTETELKKYGLDAVDKDSLHYFGVVADGKIVGVSGNYTQDGNSKVQWLGWTGVNPDARGNHYGVGLVEEAIRRAKEDGAEGMR